MKATVRKSRINGTVRAPPSKSYAIRVALYSLLSDVEVTSFPVAQDVSSALGAIRGLGLEVKAGRIVRPKNGVRHSASLNFAGSGTTLRMMMPILSYIGGEFTLDGDETLRRRPLSQITEPLRAMGMKISGDNLPVKMVGRITETDVTVPGWESSQHISGLIYAILLAGGGTIHIKPPVISRSYIEMTCGLLKSHGARIRMDGNTIHVERSELRPFRGTIPGDYLLASFYAAAAMATSGSVRISNLPDPPKEFGDHSIVSILKDSGLDSKLLDSEWSFRSSDGRALKVDVSQSPDMAVSVAAFAPFLRGKTIISGIENLKIKESNRISTITSTLMSFGASVEQSGEIAISGPLTQEQPKIDPGNDHRIAMLATVLGLSMGSVVMDAECVGKSNPDFYSDLAGIGGDISLG